MKHRTPAIIISLCVVITAASSLSSARTWTGQNGSTVEAEFVSVSGEQVELKKEDGKTVNVPIGKLCAEDRQYIQDRIRATEEKTAGQSLYFALKLEFSTDSQAAAINIQPPWGSKVIRRSARYPDIDEENDKRKEKGVPPIIIPLLDGMTVKRSANPLLEEEEESYPELTVEYILYVEASENADFKFTIDKTPVGSVSLKISGFDPKTEKAKRIRTFKNTSDKEKEYTLELSKIESACNHFDYSPTPK